MGFYKKAAYFCIAAPFLAGFAFSVGGNSIKNSHISNNIIILIAFFMIFFGLLLGILSIVKSEKKKAILIPAGIGVILNISVVCISYASFRNAGNEKGYFEIQYEKDFGDYLYQEVMVGQVPNNNEIAETMKNLSSGVLRGCPSCKITKEDVIERLPNDYQGIFEKKEINYTYILISAKDGSGIKVVSLFPGADMQPTCEDLAQIFEAKKQAAHGFADVLCIEATK